MSGPLERGFLWGTATSAYQVEGGNQANDWAERARLGLAPAVGDACAFLQHMDQDLDRARDMGTNAFRFSLEWSRIQPRPGRIDAGAVAIYERLVDGCLARGLTPAMTLVQFTLPEWCRPRRLAWAREDVQEAFARHVRWVAERFGDRVGLFVTFNEPNVQAGAGYLTGAFPPGIRWRPDLADRALVGLLRAHAAAYRTLHEEVARRHPQLRIAVGPAQHLVAWVRSRWDLTGLMHRSLLRFNWSFVDALCAGRLVLDTRSVDVPEAKGTMDFLGVNQFTTQRATPGGLERFSSLDWSWDAGAFEELLVEAHRRSGVPVVVTENGVDDAADAVRPAFLEANVEALRRARARGADLRGYFHWSLLDNHEWHHGPGPRFGLYAVDYETQTRTPRASVDVYRRVIAAGAGAPRCAREEAA